MSVTEINKAYEALQKAEREVETLRDVYARAVNRYITSTASDAMKRIEELKAENTELRKKVVVVEFEKETMAKLGLTSCKYYPPPEEEDQNVIVSDTEAEKENRSAAAANPFPDGFCANIIGAADTKKALRNVLFFNPGKPFKGDIFVRPDPLPNSLSAGACMRLVYDPSILVGCVEAAMYQRLSFHLPMNQAVKFVPVPKPEPITSCSIRLHPIKKDDSVPPNIATWLKPALEGMVCSQDVIFAVELYLGKLYKATPLSVMPNGTGIFTKESRLTILTEDGIL
jgi:hypothetical protein